MREHQVGALSNVQEWSFTVKLRGGTQGCCSGGNQDCCGVPYYYEGWSKFSTELPLELGGIFTADEWRVLFEVSYAPPQFRTDVRMLFGSVVQQGCRPVQHVVGGRGNFHANT